MARRSRHSKKKNKTFPLLPAALAGGAMLVGGALYLAFSSHPAEQRTSRHEDGGFNISEYRRDASRLTGNRYRIAARVENIDTEGNDRMVAVSIVGNKQERLPLLVRKGVSPRVNLTRGDTFYFDVECCTGRDAQQKEIKGILVVRNMETK